MSTARAEDEPLVSVIIPAFNALETLAATLASVRAQTHVNLEIIVVDDGSRDDTALLARRIAEDDPRIRVLRQANAGVAAARNHGIQEAHGQYLAFIDADDLWAPTKIAAQMAALETNGDDFGLAYCWSARIDADGVVSTDWDRPLASGAVLVKLMRGNFVGNGSATLVRADIARAAGGFDSRLHHASAQGCEDILFYLKAAALTHFVVVQEHLVGYRVTEANMSSNPNRMWRSWMLVADEMEKLHPGHRHHIRSGLANYGYWLFEGMIRRRRFAPALDFLGFILRERPILAPRLLACSAGSAIWHVKFRIVHLLRFGLKLLPMPRKLPPRLFGRRFITAVAPR